MGQSWQPSDNSTEETDSQGVGDGLANISNILLNRTDVLTVEKQYTNAVEDNSDSIYEEEPVDIETFLYSPEYLGLNITLSPAQLEFVDYSSRIYEDPIYTEGVLQCGQGSGKDTCSIFINLRIVYLLWCLKSPQKFFNMASNSFIDLINVAPTADIAKNIYFQTLINMVNDSNLFKDKIPAKITSKVMDFPKNIRLISGNSADESWQGYTPILIVLDEIDAFKSEMELQRSKSLRHEGAEGVYKTAKALVQSRFPGVGKILCLSWPRFKGSFIQRRFQAGILEEKTYVPSKEDGTPYCTWEFNPTKSKEDFIDFYKTDPDLAKARFECDPPYARDAFIKDAVPVLRAFDADIDDRDNVVHAAMKPIRSEFDLVAGTKYYLHIDLGQKHSNAALGIAHKEDDTIIVDLLKVWTPKPGDDIELKDVQDFIVRLRAKGIRIMEATYDKFQSLDSIQQLQKLGINANYKSVTRTAEAYDTFKDLVYQEKVDGYFDEELITEILGLERVFGDKVEARPGFKKDRADAVVGAVHGAMKGAANDRFVKSVGSIQDMFGNGKTSPDDGLGNAAQFVHDIERGRQDRLELSISGPDDCDSCGRTGGLEMSYDGVRVSLIEDANYKACLVCGTRWSLVKNKWLITKQPDDVLMSQFGGRY